VVPGSLSSHANVSSMACGLGGASACGLFMRAGEHGAARDSSVAAANGGPVGGRQRNSRQRTGAGKGSRRLVKGIQGEGVGADKGGGAGATGSAVGCARDIALACVPGGGSHRVKRAGPCSLPAPSPISPSAVATYSWDTYLCPCGRMR